MPTAADSAPFTNGDAVKLLQSLRADGEFGVLCEGDDEEILRKIYSPLKALFLKKSKSSKTSNANYNKIQKIDARNDFEKASCHFRDWESSPIKFWERPGIETLRYSDKQPSYRPQMFVLSAVTLDHQIEDQQILQRFVAVEVYALFKRVVEEHSSLIRDTHVGCFLERLGLQASNANIEAYGSIIRRGKKMVSFCKELRRHEHLDGSDFDDGEDTDAIGFGVLFLSSIPNSIWDAYGLIGEDQKKSIKHLQDIGVVEKARTTGADRIAKYLLNFHKGVIWMQGDESGSRKRRASQLQTTKDHMKRRQIEFDPDEVSTQVLEIDEGRRFPETTPHEGQRCLVSPPTNDGQNLITLASAACAAEADFPLQSGERPGFPDSMQIGQQVYSDTARLEHASASLDGLAQSNDQGRAPSLSIEMFPQMFPDDFAGAPLLSIEELLQSTMMGSAMGQDVPPVPETAATPSWSAPPSSESHGRENTNTAMSATTMSMETYFPSREYVQQSVN